MMPRALLTISLIAFATSACHSRAARVPNAAESLGSAIASFTASLKTVAPGEPVVLSWRVRGAEEVVLQGAPQAPADREEGMLKDIGKFPATGSVEVRPEKSMVYVLSCEGTKGSSCASLSVRVPVSAKSARPSPKS